MLCTLIAESGVVDIAAITLTGDRLVDQSAELCGPWVLIMPMQVEIINAIRKE
ncbi:hypothetical protein BDW68DRAFT_101384 [Aspergillus falconensis]